MSLRMILRIPSVSVVLLAGFLVTGTATSDDWPQWCGSDGKNMVSSEKGLPDSFVPGARRGGGDGVCYAFAALTSVPDQPVRLKTV